MPHMRILIAMGMPVVVVVLVLVCRLVRWELRAVGYSDFCNLHGAGSLIQGGRESVAIDQ